MAEIKGSAVVDAVSAYRTYLPEECKRVLDSLDPETRACITEVQANEWIPVDAFVRYLQAQVDVAGGDAHELLLSRSKIVLDRQLRGVYRIFAKLSSPHALIVRLATVNALFFRGIAVERLETQKGAVVLRYRGFEKPHRLMEPIIAGFFQAVLEINGAKDLAVKFTRPIGSPDHAELVLSWR